MMTLTEYLRREGLTQAEFAKKVGLNQATVSKICRGKAGLRLETAMRVSLATGGSVAVQSLAPIPGAAA